MSDLAMQIIGRMVEVMHKNMAKQQMLSSMIAQNQKVIARYQELVIGLENLLP